MNLIARTLSGDLGTVTVDTRKPLGRGATALVYPARLAGSARPFAAKLYHPDRRLNAEKIRAMLANPPSNLDTDVAGMSYPQLAWPVAILVETGGRNAGYLMPALDLSGAHTLDTFYDQILFRKLNSPSEAALSYKLEIARNLCLLVADLHQHGHCFIDMKPQNIRVLLGSHVVTLLDCDGFSIAGVDGQRYPAELVSTDYIAPEVLRAKLAPPQLGEEQDRYALAVILFQLLNRGTHPFQGILRNDRPGSNTNDEKAAQGLYPHGFASHPDITPRQQSLHHLWPDGLRLQFDRAFVGQPKDRPAAQDWARLLDDMLRNKALTRCEAHPADVAHIHFAEKGCPACYLQGLTRGSPTQAPAARPAQRVSPKTTQPTGAAPSAPAPGARTTSVTQTGPEPGFGFVFKTVFGPIAVMIVVLMITFNANKPPAPPLAPPQSLPAPLPAPAPEPSPNPKPAANAKPSATQSPEQVEARVWAAAEKAGRRADFQRYLDRYPNGRYATLARHRLTSAAEEGAASTQDKEAAAWEAAQRDGSPAAYAQFLRSYPNSALAPLARVRAGR